MLGILGWLGILSGLFFIGYFLRALISGSLTKENFRNRKSFRQNLKIELSKIRKENESLPDEEIEKLEDDFEKKFKRETEGYEKIENLDSLFIYLISSLSIVILISLVIIIF